MKRESCLCSWTLLLFFAIHLILCPELGFFFPLKIDVNGMQSYDSTSIFLFVYSVEVFICKLFISWKTQTTYIQGFNDLTIFLLKLHYKFEVCSCSNSSIIFVVVMFSQTDFLSFFFKEIQFLVTQIFLVDLILILILPSDPAKTFNLSLLF